MTRIISTIQYLGADRLPSAANINQSGTRSLTDPEAHILLLLKAGKSRTEIAPDVGADEAAVKEHIKAILRKAVGASNRRRAPKRPIGIVLEEFPPVAEH
jgi:DNA-binding NarL/FixJ family response regulator